ncbi:MAG: hypothetical protein GY906_13455 [bacterium]|nr:hypothetical protein [bacterium]
MNDGIADNGRHAGTSGVTNGTLNVVLNVELRCRDHPFFDRSARGVGQQLESKRRTRCGESDVTLKGVLVHW